MKLQICNDLHIEFTNYEYELKNHGADVLVLAGDIGVGTKHVRWMHGLQKKFKHIVYVPGNHEYYNQEIIDVNCFWYDWAWEKPNFHFLQTETAEIEGVKFAGCTLWTDIDHGDWFALQGAKKYMTDFQIIQYKGQKFTAYAATKMHEEHKNFLNNQKDIDVVVTHHAPTHACIQPQWDGNRMNGCFAANCDDVIENLKPKLWIHGHMHDTIDFQYNDHTRIVCNPKGYTQKHKNENDGFNQRYIVEI